MGKCVECGYEESTGKFCSQCGGKVSEAVAPAGKGDYEKNLYSEKGAGQVSTDQSFRLNCTVCELPISSGKITVDALDYHIACFKCHKCDKKLNLHTYRKLDKSFYCSECIDKNGTLYQKWKTTDDAKRFAQKKEEVKATAGNTIGTGCYLTYETASSGSLFINWKEQAVDGAIAYFKPKKTVPKFKFIQKGGKDELTRGCESTEMKNYYSGVCNFVKICKEFDGDFIQFKDDVCAVYVHLQDDKVEKWDCNTWHDLTVLPKLCVSVQPSSSTAYKGVKSLGKDAFISAGSRGAALAIKS